MTVTTSLGGTIRWTSPELFDPERFGLQDSRPTKKSDCYALGMVILEVLSGQVPFVGDGDFVVVRKVIVGEFPRRPEEAWFTSGVWALLESCWAPEPPDRPRLEYVLRCLEEASPSWTRLSRLVSSTANASKSELTDPDRILTMDVSQDTSPSLEVMSQSAQETTIHNASSGPDNTQVRSFLRPPSPPLTRVLRRTITPRCQLSWARDQPGFPTYGLMALLKGDLSLRI